jgi:hypothetical protein
MIHGAHVILYSKDAEADRAFFRDVLKYRYADAGHGWLIFALPPAEVAVHPADDEAHELYLMCDDVRKLVAEMDRKGIATEAVHEERWGLLTQVSLPSGTKLGIYEPRHPSPLDRRAKSPKKRAAKKKAPPKKASRTPTKKAAKRGKRARR